MQLHSEPTAASDPQPAAAQHPVSDTIRSSWNFSLDRIRADMSHYPIEHQEALIALFRWCIDDKHPMRRRDAAQRIGCSENLLYQIYTGIYRNPDKSLRAPSEELISSILDFLSLEQKRFEGGQTEFVLTPTAKKVFDACDLARESQTVVFMWGPSHIGKTWALEHYAAANNHGRTIYCRLHAASGLGGLVRRIADACGISDKSNTAALIDRIKRALSPNTLLILDECHLLSHTYRKGSFHNCMEVIRELHDESKCGQLLCFTILEAVQAASQKELQQLWRRGVHKVPLPVMPTKEDLAAILKHCGLDFPKADLRVTIPTKNEDKPILETPYEILRQVARRDGLKAITERVRYARKLAGKSGAKLSWFHFVNAHLIIEKQSIQKGEWH